MSNFQEQMRIEDEAFYGPRGAREGLLMPAASDDPLVSSGVFDPPPYFSEAEPGCSSRARSTNYRLGSPSGDEVVPPPKYTQLPCKVMASGKAVTIMPTIEEGPGVGGSAGEG